MNELYSMSVALTMMDHIKANVSENKIAKELLNLKIVAKIICYCENMICSLWPRCKGHLVNWFIVFSWCYIVFVHTQAVMRRNTRLRRRDSFLQFYIRAITAKE